MPDEPETTPDAPGARTSFGPPDAGAGAEADEADEKKDKGGKAADTHKRT